MKTCGQHPEIHQIDVEVAVILRAKCTSAKSAEVRWHRAPEATLQTKEAFGLKSVWPNGVGSRTVNPWHWHWRNDVMKCFAIFLKKFVFEVVWVLDIGERWHRAHSHAPLRSFVQVGRHAYLTPGTPPQSKMWACWVKTTNFYTQNMVQTFTTQTPKWSFWKISVDVSLFRSIQYLSLRLRCHAWFSKPSALRLGATLNEKSASTLSIGRIAMSGKCIQPRVGSWIIQLAHVAIDLGEMQSHNLTDVAGSWSGNFYEDSECWTAVEEKSQRNFNFGFGFFSNLTRMLKQLKSCWFSLSSQRCMQKSCSSAFGFKDPIELLPCLVDKHSILQFVWGIFSAIQSDVFPCSIANAHCGVFRRMSCKIPAEWMNPATSNGSQRSNFLVFLSLGHLVCLGRITIKCSNIQIFNLYDDEAKDAIY